MTNLKTSAAGIAAAVIVMLTTSACGADSHAKVASLGNGSSSSSQSGGGSGDSNQSFRDALLDYSKCMREHGVDMPDPTFTDTGDGGGGGGAVIAGGPGKDMDPTSATFKAAETACKPIMDNAQKNFTPPSPEEQARMRDQALKFAQCMRSHGVDVPDPTFDENGGMSIEVHGGPGPDGSASSGDANTAGPDPQFQEAAKACEAETGGPGIGTGPTSANGPVSGGAGK
jgi:hypothetical protein